MRVATKSSKLIWSLEVTIPIVPPKSPKCSLTYVVLLMLCVHACRCVCVCVFMGMWPLEDKLSNIPQEVPSIYLFESGLFSGYSSLSRLDRLAREPKDLSLSPSTSITSILPYPALYMSTGDLTQVFMFSWQEIYRLIYFPNPNLSSPSLKATSL